MRRLWVVAAVGAVAVAALFVGISMDQQRCTVTYQNNEFLALEVDPVNVDFGPVSLDDYAQGYVERLLGQRLYVTANSPWVVTVVAGAPFWGRQFSPGGPTFETQKPCQDLELRTSDQNTIGDFGLILTQYAGMDDQLPQAVAAGGGESVYYEWDMDVRVLLSLERDRLPGIYFLTYTYTLSPQQ